MSIVRNRKLKKVGITNKIQKRKARKYIKTFIKCNRGFAYNNIAWNMNLLDDFCMYGRVIPNSI